jgi:hypothetical protein
MKGWKIAILVLGTLSSGWAAHYPTSDATELGKRENVPRGHTLQMKRTPKPTTGLSKRQDGGGYPVNVGLADLYDNCSGALILLNRRVYCGGPDWKRSHNI